MSMSEAIGSFIVFGCGIFISIAVLVSEIVFKKAYESKTKIKLRNLTGGSWLIFKCIDLIFNQDLHKKPKGVTPKQHGSKNKYSQSSLPQHGQIMTL